ncbi:MAG TPA: nucleotide exchange factor GrpE [Candidatus Babeliales bacterium]|nr:nucleotide exchange factor GrpE [Candidatus Babeliales bacterium]
MALDNHDNNIGMDDVTEQQAGCCSQDAAPETEKTSNELAACQQQLAEWKEKYLHSIADFQNFKRRQERDQANWMQSAQVQVFKQLIGIVDDFDRAIAESKKVAGHEEWLTGFEMIHASLHKMLTASKVTEITERTVFNPDIHEAIASVDAPGVSSGNIVDVVQKGYMFKDQVLRPAQVTVAR